MSWLLQEVLKIRKVWHLEQSKVLSLSWKWSSHRDPVKIQIFRLPGESEDLESGDSDGKGWEEAPGLEVYMEHIHYSFGLQDMGYVYVYIIHDHSR